MNDSQSHDTTGGTDTEPTGGDPDATGESTVMTDGGSSESVDYLDVKINLLSPSTDFMRDHLKLIWGSFVAWVIMTWGPVTATYLATDTMTSTTIIGFPAHYFTVAFLAPTSSLILAAIYAHRRDKLDERYGIGSSSKTESASGAEDAAATDGGVAE